MKKQRRRSAARNIEESPRQTERPLAGPTIIVLAILMIVIAVFLYWQASPASDVLLQQGREALQQRNYGVALSLAEQLLERDGSNFEAMLLAGETAAATGNFEQAQTLFKAIPATAVNTVAIARRNAADIELMHYKRLSSAEQLFRQALSHDPYDLVSNEHLAFVLGVTSRNWDVIPYRLKLIELDRVEPLHLYLLSLSEAAMENDDLVSDYHHHAPDDPGPLVAMSRMAFEERDYSTAATLAARAISINPKLVEAHIKLGKAILETGNDDALIEWHAALPVEAEAHPEIWVLRAAWAQRSAASMAAARCYWEAVRRDANHQTANYQLGRELAGLGRNIEAQPFLQRAENLQEYVNAVKVAVTLQHETELIKAAEIAERLGLVWEAYAWFRISLEINPTPASDAKCQQLRSTYFDRAKLTTRNIAKANPALQLDLSDLPLADFSPSSVDRGAVATNGLTSQPSFRNDATSVGLSFRYYNGGDPTQDIRKMYEFTGGGVAILDFDGDGWPDIHLTQGCDWPPDSRQRLHYDRLFRSSDGVYEDVTVAACVDEHAFSQGATVGDFDNDGFPDLYVSNIGKNSLFRNNGDGTFSRHEHLSGSEVARWTTSCLLADINSDGLPDLYDVNYLSGENVFTAECESSGICMPQTFPAEQDQLYLNQGDGSFTNATELAGIQAEGGKGLGVAFAELGGEGVPGLFIANDSETNFFFRNTAEQGTFPQFVEEGLLTGLAVNDDGRAEACMGVAVGDANGDALLDVYVTNFYHESNTLFIQANTSDFRDATHQAGLRDPSMQMLGFGTQFLDTDLDGWLDLFVANGHIDDFRDTGTPFQMRPQYFHNLGTGRFQEVADSGEYFQDVYLGRAVARLDWNKDGRDDLLVGHLDSDVALLTNTTHPTNNYLAVQLRGTVSSRDAIGTVVRVELADRVITRQLTAGDGYQASNERRLVFGLGAANKVDALTVQWPSGHQQTTNNVSVNHELLFVEHRDDVTELHSAAK